MHQKGQYGAAEKHYRQALSLDPQFADAIHHLGIIAFQSQRLEEAATLIRRAIALDPKDSSAYSNLGMVLEDLNKLDDALHVFDQAILINHRDVAAHLNRGNVLQKLKRWSEALDSYDRIISLAPQYADAYNNRGNVLRELKNYPAAIESFDVAIRLNPHFAQAINGKGIVFNDMGRAEEALHEHARALQIMPDYADAFNNRGMAFMALKRYDLAKKDFDRALELNTQFTQAYFNRAGLFEKTDQFENAIEDFEKVLSIDPSMTLAIGILLYFKMQRCEWKDFDRLSQQFLGLIKQDACLTKPFTALMVTDSLSIQKQSAEYEVRTILPFNDKLGPIDRPKKHHKIRLGYFSADLKEHAVAYLTAELFEKYNRNDFEVIAFSVGAEYQDAMKQRIASACDRFIEVGNESDEMIAKIARDLGIDIAIDLGRLTANNRFGIFSFRAAPVQVSYIGYLGTTGASYIDYLLADNTLIPEQARSFYTEKIAYLPSYQINDSKRLISDRVFTRAELGLPETGFVFCCINNNFKFTPNTFDSWMRILKATEGASLLLFANHAMTESNLKREAFARGVDPTRMIFCHQVPRADYLARYRVADLFLDTFPYNAGTTASDALWAGLPVLTMAGESFASRICASILNAIDLPELITETRDDFEQQAIALAHHPEKLKQLKSKIAQNRYTTPLFESELFCQNLELVYKKMHHRTLSGLDPEHILL